MQVNGEGRGGHGRPWVAVALVGVALAVGLGTPWFLDYDEAVYAEAARGMLASGDWVRPQWNGRPFYEKPALFYWLTASLYVLIGVTPVAPRLISLIATLGGLAFLAAEARRRLDARAAEAAVWVAGATLLPFSLGRLGLLDALLTAAITVSLLAFARGLEESAAAGRRRWLALGYAATGVAMAVKGPVFPPLIGAILLVDALVRRRVIATLRASGLGWGAPLLLAIGAPWYVLAYMADGPLVIEQLIGTHTLGRLAGPLQGHGGPLWYYLPVLVLALLPLTALLPGAVAVAHRFGAPERRLATLAGAWAAVIVVAFSLAATKLPQYAAPAIPALALLVAIAVPRLRRSSWHATLAAAALPAAGLAAMPYLLGQATAIWGDRVLRDVPGLACLPTGGWRWAFVLPAASLVAGAVAAWRRGRAGDVIRAVRALGIASALSWAALWIVLGHQAQAMAIAPLVTLAERADRELPTGAPIHLIELNHRVTTALATGRRIVFLSAKRPENLETLRAALAGPAAARAVVPAAWWSEIHTVVGGRELATECGHVLVGEAR